MLNVGEKDYGFVTEDGAPNYEYVDDGMEKWAVAHNIPLTDENKREFSDGRNYGTEYTNEDGIVVLCSQWNEEKIHAMVPEDTYAVYDFLCNYSRGEDGTSYFMGKEIKLK